MSEARAEDEREALALASVAALLGARPDALRAEPVRRAARALAPAQLTCPERLAELARLAVVAETYLFRHPEQLRLGAAEALDAWRARGGVRLHAWSAGCATGEEAWSLAAVLAAALPPAQVDVLGSDVVPAHVEAARRGEYGRWSCRATGPHEWRALEPGTERVDDRLRGCARFAVHNLLDAPVEVPDGGFDLIACRNVLVYMSDEAARRVLEHLARALAPGGVLMLGPADLPPGLATPAGLVGVGPSDLLCWARRAPSPSPSPSPSPAPRTSSGATPRAPAPRPRSAATIAATATATARAPLAPAPAVRPAPALAEHVAALGDIERGELDRAERRLADLLALTPGYAAGHLERALVLARLGRPSAASGAARAALARVEGVADEVELEGPTPCSAGHVRQSARALLGRLRGTT